MNQKHFMLRAAIAAAFVGVPTLLMAQPATSKNAGLPGLDTVEAPRVTQTIDNRVLVPVNGSHLAFASQIAPSASVADSMPMNHLQLVLRPSAQRAAALHTLLADLHNPKSPRFQHWLTPAQYGKAFGVNDSDIAAAKAWLVAQGFTVNGVYPNKMQIDFSGTAGLVKQAFHTQENHYNLNGVDHIANAADISIPAALAPVVAGVVGLNNLHPHPLHVAPRIGEWDAKAGSFRTHMANTGKTKPQAVIFQGGVRGLVPNDLIQMYGVASLRTGGITGSGVTIAVVEDSDMVPTDWTNFVSTFNLGKFGGTFSQIQPQAAGMTNCIDPADGTPQTESIETVLDAEWSTAIAPSANIVVASCSDSNASNFFGGVFTAATNLINGTSRPDIISASYGYGEKATDAASKTAIDAMWAQADAEGISVFVSTGDSGSNPSFNGGVINNSGGIGGVDANSFATSPSNTGVGGTDVADVLDGTTSQYFRSKPNADFGTAMSYIPEIPWNQSCGNTVAAKALDHGSGPVKFCKDQLAANPNLSTIQSEAGSGGPSAVDRKPVWQRLVYNAARDQSRDLPDVSLFAGSYGGYTWVILCTGAQPCNPGWAGGVTLEGGTSLASPMFAGIQALIDQGLAKRGLPQDQGNAAPTLYALAAYEYGGPSGPAPASRAVCSADNGTNGTVGCMFHDITRGSIASNCFQDQPAFTSPNCYYYGTSPDGAGGTYSLGLTTADAAPTAYGMQNQAFAARPGWSFASGLGSVNAAMLLRGWQRFIATK